MLLKKRMSIESEIIIFRRFTIIQSLHVAAAVVIIVIIITVIIGMRLIIVLLVLVLLLWLLLIVMMIAIAIVIVAVIVVVIHSIGSSLSGLMICHSEWSVAKHGTVHFLQCCCCLFRFTKTHKSVAFWLACSWICHDSSRDNSAKFSERLI